MKALIFQEPNQPIVKDIAEPKLEATEVLVRMRQVGICHSDYELLYGRYIIPISYPVTPGHEWIGEVVEVGKGVKGFKRWRPCRWRMRGETARPHPPFRFLDGWRVPRILQGSSGMDPQIARSR